MNNDRLEEKWNRERRMKMELKFRTKILQNGTMDAAYVEVPYDIKQLTGKGRWLVDAAFDGVPYRGQVVKMKTPFYLVGITKAIRKQIGKTFGDEVEVTLKDREEQKEKESPQSTESTEQRETVWTCPECGRSFKKKDQSHYCGKKPETIDEYIQAQDPKKQDDLNTIRVILRNALPEATEKISWSMPTYWKDHNIIHFAAQKKHIGLYPGPDAIQHFEKDLKPYKTSKGSIQIPYGKIDEELITRIARWCLETDHHA